MPPRTAASVEAAERPATRLAPGPPALLKRFAQTALLIAQLVYARERGSFLSGARWDFLLEEITVPGCVLQLLGAI